MSDRAVVFVGPTGSGKTKASLDFFRLLSSGPGIINADALQVYRQLSVGTARPAESDMAGVPHYLFGHVDCVAQSYSRADHRRLVEQVVSDARSSSSKAPYVVVGGSLFYVEGLLFRLFESEGSSAGVDYPVTWDHLNEVDSVRAGQLHPNDSYRIARALDIYYSSGVAPSKCAPVFDPVFSDVKLICIVPDSESSKLSIYKRTEEMLLLGWVEEVAGLVGTEWESFIAGPYALGYSDVYQWVMRGRLESEYSNLCEVIASKTFKYAQRQLRYWRGLKKKLACCQGVSCYEVSSSYEAVKKAAELSSSE